VLPENREAVLNSLELLIAFSLQPFGFKIVATALHHNCKILYSEDMQHRLIIEDRLIIVNPFSDKKR